MEEQGYKPPLKARLIQTLVWPIVTYDAEAWTLSKDLRGNIEAFEMQCYRRSCHKWNGAGESRLETVKSRKLIYFGHISRHISLEKDIMFGTMPGLRRQGGQRIEWSVDLVEWTEESIPDWRFEDLFMRSPTLASRVRHLDWLIDEQKCFHRIWHSMFSQ